MFRDVWSLRHEPSDPRAWCSEIGIYIYIHIHLKEVWVKGEVKKTGQSCWLLTLDRNPRTMSISVFPFDPFFSSSFPWGLRSWRKILTGVWRRQIDELTRRVFADLCCDHPTLYASYENIVIFHKGISAYILYRASLRFPSTPSALAVQNQHETGTSSCVSSVFLLHIVQFLVGIAWYKVCPALFSTWLTSCAVSKSMNPSESNDSTPPTLSSAVPLCKAVAENLVTSLGWNGMWLRYSSCDMVLECMMDGVVFSIPSALWNQSHQTERVTVTCWWHLVGPIT